jgi:acyl-CoA reductase-like NAD-dependent aldehyde dehydrogenase
MSASRERETLRLVDPFTGEPGLEVPCDAPAEVDAKLERAHAAQRAWCARSLDERIAEVHSALVGFAREKEAIAREIGAQMGKPVTQARAEVDTMLARAEHMLAIAGGALASEELSAPPGFRLAIRHEPLGVVLDIAAWNYPLLVPINVIVPALVAGNALVLKHSPRTPLVGGRFARAFATLAEQGVFASVVVPDERAADLVRDPRVDHVAFTGSVPTGRAVYRLASERLIDVGLELGGKDAAYVAEDADLGFAAAHVVDGACYNAGQSCCAVERVIVHRRVSASFVERVLRVLAEYRLGDPQDEATTLGPLVDGRARARVAAHVTDALARGARLVHGGKPPPGLRGYFHEPTLLADCPIDALAWREETFGPVLPVRSVDSDDEALALMNDSRYGLTASVWTRDERRAERFARELEVGTVFQNRCDYLDPALPWTGWKESGLGSTLSRHGYLALTRRKSLHFRR